jgi:hypothetical protein
LQINIRLINFHTSILLFKYSTMAAIATAANFPPEPTIPTDWSSHKAWHIRQFNHLQDCIGVLRQWYHAQAAGYIANPATAFLHDNVVAPAIYNEVGIEAMLDADAASARQTFIIKDKIHQDSKASSIRQLQLIELTKNQFTKCLLPHQIDIAKGAHNSITSAPLHDIINNLTAHYASPPLGEISSLEDNLSAAWTDANFDIQLSAFNNQATYYAICAGAPMTELAKYRHLKNKSTFGILASYLAHTVERYEETHSLGGAGATATQATFIAVLRPRFTNLTPTHIANSSQAFANVASINYTGTNKNVLKVAQALPTDVTTTSTIIPHKANSRPTSPAADAHAGYTPVRQGQT